MFKRIVFLMVFVFLLIPNKLYASSIKDTHLDVILVVDTSNSMKGSDPDRISIEGVKLFIDLMESNGSRVAIIGFNGQLTFRTPITELNTEEDKKRLIQNLDNIEYTGFTDMGLALKEAELLLSRNQSTNQPLVVMFTDGYVEVDPKTNRTAPQSKKEIDEVLLGVKGKVPIYTIGLDKQNRVDVGLIEKISSETYAECYVTSDAKDLPEIFFDIFTRVIKSHKIKLKEFTADGSNYADVSFTIPNSSVMEANIVIYSKDEIQDVALLDPSKNQKNFSGNDVYFSKSQTYSMIKIINPQKGEWNLKVKGVKDDVIKVNLLYNYSLQINCFTNTQSFLKNTEIEILGEITNSNTKITDADLINSFNAELEVMDADKNVLKTIPMTINGPNFSAKYMLPDENALLYFKINAAGFGFYRESNYLEIQLKNNAPELKEPIKNITFFHFPILFNNYKLDLNKYFIDKEGDKITFRPMNYDKINININQENILNIKTKNFFAFGSTDVSITASDQNDSDNFDFKVTLIPVFFIVLIIVLILFAILIMPSKLKNIKESKRLFKGNLKYELINEGVHSAKKHVNLALYKGRVSLQTILEQDFSGLDKITIVQEDGEYALSVRNKSSNEIVSLKNLGLEFTLNQNETITIKSNDNSKEINITYYL